MKYILFFPIILTIACTENDTPVNLHTPDTYELKALLLDPGDGSGTFQPVQSKKRIEWHANGNLSCFGNICSMSKENDTLTKASWQGGDQIIISEDCGQMSYEIKGDTLDIRFPYCIEPCISRYIKSKE